MATAAPRLVQALALSVGLSWMTGCDPDDPADTSSASLALTGDGAKTDGSAAHAGSAAKKEDRAAPQKNDPGNPETAAADVQTDAEQADNPPRDAPRVYAKSRHVWIRSGPTTTVQWLGFLWQGGTVKIRGDERRSGAGCSGEWTPVEPRGWVCVDGERATTDADDPAFLALYPYRPKTDSPWPHQYAAVHADAARYDWLPSKEEQKGRERGYEAHLAEVKQARTSGSTDSFADYLGTLDVGLSGNTPPSFALRGEEASQGDEPFKLPAGLSEGRVKIVGRSAMAYSKAFDHEDRAFLLAPDMSWVPRDRVEPLSPVMFEGLELKGDISLPLAFFRGKTRPAYKQLKDGTFEEVPEHFPRLSHVLLTNKTVRDGHTVYYKLRNEDLWVSSRQAVVPTPREKTPWGAEVGKPDTTERAREGRGTWLEASILGGWLVAFEGTTPVYVTMISAGRGGKPHPGKDPLETASTPTGYFPIGGKFKTASMDSSSSPIVHGDVPWTQNFSGPYAIHSAYWHDDWGSLKSAGCVNVAPKDGKWLFEFTEPEVPEGWHGVRHVSRYGGSTLFVLHE